MPTNTAINRSQYIVYPEARRREPLPADPVEIRPPKKVPAPPPPPGMAAIFIKIIMPVFLIMAIVLFVGVEAVGGIFIFMAISIMTGLVTGGTQWWQYQKAKATYLVEKAQVEQDYLAYLEEKEEMLQRISQLQGRILWEQHPPVSEMVKRTQKNRNQLWQRLPFDDDFLALRIGTTTVPLCVPFRIPADDEVPLYSKILALQQEYEQIPDVPLAINVQKMGTIGLRGRQREAMLQVANSLLAHLATHHSPEIVRVYVISHHADAPRRWAWVRWLPQANSLLDKEHHSPHISYMAETDDDVLIPLAQLLRRRLDRSGRIVQTYGEPEPHLFIIFDNVFELRRYQAANILLTYQRPDGSDRSLQASALFIGNVPPQVNAQIEVSDKLLEYRERWTPAASQVIVSCKPELTTTEQAERLARQLAPLRPEGSYQTATGSLPVNVRLVELLNATQPLEVDLSALYGTRYDPQKIMAFPIGLNMDARPQMVVLREDGQGGNGHHALLAGATGKGKSVTLLSTVLSLAANNPPNQLNFVLADFKGGASELARLRQLPHVVGFVTDLDEAYVERFRLSMEGEILYRKRLFDSTPQLLGRQIQNIYEYNKACPDNLLPHLVVVIDEFAKALQLNPEFKDTIEKEIARQGRALGIHLILSSQKAIDFMPVRPNIEVRMSMQLQTNEDSRAIFNRDDAARKLTRAGQALLQVGDNQIFELFQVARADIPYRTEGANLALLDDFVIRRLLADGRREILYRYQVGNGALAPDTPTNQLSEAEMLVEHIRLYCQGKYKPARTICLPPLPPAEALPLPTVLSEEPVYCLWQQDAGWDKSRALPARRLKVAVGLLDLPLQQAQRPFILDLTQHDGHFIVTGPPGSGKGLACRTMVMALALAHPPNDLLFYFVGSGPTLSLFEELPHCQALVQSNEMERIARLFGFLSQEEKQRSQKLRDHKVDTIAALRDLQPDSALPTLIIVFDDFAGFTADHHLHNDILDRLIAKGNQVDLHLIFSLTSLRGAQARLLQNTANRLALGIRTGADTLEVFGRRSKPLPEIMGRGYIVQEQDLLTCQVAAPNPKEGSDLPADREIDSTQAWVMAMKNSWSWTDGNRPLPAIVELPSYIELKSLWHNHPLQAQAVTEAQTAAVGLDYDFLQPIYFNFGKLQPYNLVLGPPQSGKTDFLISLCLSAAVNLVPTQIEIYVFTLRSSSPLRLLRGLPQVQFASNYSRASKLLHELGAILANRLSEQRAFQEQTDVTISDVTRIIPKRTLILIDDLHRLNQYEDLNGLVDQCMDYARSLGVCLFLADAGLHINQARQNFSVKYIQAACRFGSGLTFSVDPNDLALLNQTGKLSNPMLTHHRPHIGKGRAIFVAAGRPKIVQFARLGQANLPPALYEKEIRTLVQEIASPYGSGVTDKEV